jgi:Ferric reductase like transmembrane component
VAGDRPVERVPALRRVVRLVAVMATAGLSAALSGWLVGTTAVAVSGNRNAPWIIGRAAGLSAYLLMVLLVATGLVLSHPGRARLRRPRPATRIRLHVSLAVFTLALTVLHVVVLATDSYAGVGWRGTLVPMGSTYRPVPVTLGVIALYAGLLAGLTAELSGRRVAARVWWPVHKVAAVALLLAWGHGVLAGIDTPLLLWLYLSTGAAVLVLAAWRYIARTPRDLVDELAAAPGSQVRHGVHSVPTPGRS